MRDFLLSQPAPVDELVGDDGAMFLQAIVIGDHLYEAEKAAASFANTHVFPGGCLPSEREIAACLDRYSKIHDYTCIFHKRERIDGRVGQ